jgi:hypothetical protein
MALPPLPLSLADRISEAYSAWGISVSAPGKEATTRKDLEQPLIAAEKVLPEMHCRAYPSTFDPLSESLRAFPQPLKPRWLSLERALRQCQARSVMIRLPHFWQQESPAHAACRNVGAALFVGEPENIPVGAAAIDSCAIDTVVAEISEASAFVAYLHKKNLRVPSHWILIHQAESPSWTLPDELALAAKVLFQEVHLLPGVPILVQCPLLASQKAPRFHTSDAYLWEHFDSVYHITSLGDDPLPIVRFALDRPLRQEGTCPCGRPIVV